MEELATNSAEEPQLGEEGSLGPIRGRWTKIGSVGFYLFPLELGDPHPEGYARMFEVLEGMEPYEPKDWGGKYVLFVERLRRSLFGAL